VCHRRSSWSSSSQCNTVPYGLMEEAEEQPPRLSPAHKHHTKKRRMEREAEHEIFFGLVELLMADSK
jgi:hypothetical protein